MQGSIFTYDFVPGGDLLTLHFEVEMEVVAVTNLLSTLIRTAEWISAGLLDSKSSFERPNKVINHRLALLHLVVRQFSWWFHAFSVALEDS